MHISPLKTALFIACSVLAIGCKKATQQTEAVILEHDPVIEFSWAGNQIAPAVITFTNNSQNAKDFKWDFGNGTSSSSQFPGTVKFGQPGSYQVILTATNSRSKKLLTKTIVIAADQGPVANFSCTFKDDRSYAPATLQLTNNSLNALSYEWEINGRIYNTVSPAGVVLNTAGNYEISLIAINGAKRSAPFKQTISVMASAEPRSGFVFAYHPFPYTVGEEIQLVNTSLNSDSWSWTFGANGPAPSTEQHPVIRFTKAGDYPITLMARKGNLSAAPKTITLRINP